MRLSRALRPVLAVTLTVTGAMALASPAVADTGAVVDRPRGNVVSIFGDAGDPVGQGKTKVWRSGADKVTMTPAGEGVRVRAQSPDGEVLEIVAQPWQHGLFSNGEFPNAGATPTATAGALTVVNGGRSCTGGGSGWFKILDRSEDQGRLWLLFEQRCAGAAGPLFGEIRINQENDPALLTAPMRFEFPAEQIGTAGATVPITVINTGSEPVTINSADIVGQPGYGPFRPVGDDNFGLGGTVTFGIVGNTCAVLQPGESCVVLTHYRPLLFAPTEAVVTLSDSTPAGKHSSSVSAPSAAIPG